jgi:hypothetical protein
MGNTARRMRHSHLLLLAGATLARAFDLTCFGPGRGITLPGQVSTHTMRSNTTLPCSCLRR